MNGRDAVIRDDAEAAIWYRRAAEQGNTYAQTFLGHMYANGRGVPQDDAEAVRQYRPSAGPHRPSPRDRGDVSAPGGPLCAPPAPAALREQIVDGDPRLRPCVVTSR